MPDVPSPRITSNISVIWPSLPSRVRLAQISVRRNSGDLIRPDAHAPAWLWRLARHVDQKAWKDQCSHGAYLERADGEWQMANQDRKQHTLGQSAHQELSAAGAAYEIAIPRNHAPPQHR